MSLYAPSKWQEPIDSNTVKLIQFIEQYCRWQAEETDTLNVPLVTSIQSVLEKCWLTQLWQLFLVGSSNVRPYIDWKSSFSNPIYCWCRVLTCIPLCCTFCYQVWRSSSGRLFPCLSGFYMPRRHLRFPNEVNFSLCNLSSYSILRVPFTILVALLWTLSRQSISLRK